MYPRTSLCPTDGFETLEGVWSEDSVVGADLEGVKTFYVLVISKLYLYFDWIGVHTSTMVDWSDDIVKARCCFKAFLVRGMV